MCLARLGRVVALEPGGALVRIGERTWPVATLLVPEILVGDEVLVTAGLIVARLSPEEARQRRQMFEELSKLADGASPS